MHSAIRNAIGLSAFLLIAACVPGGDDSEGTGAHPMISVSSPQPNARVSSPLVVRGEARGNWYFEASFPVRLLDDEGKEIAITPAQAQGDWMTTDFVPFEATLVFNTAADRGTLVLEKDNPSGEPQFDDKIEIPVTF